jgi:hypothetical protein
VGETIHGPFLHGHRTQFFSHRENGKIEEVSPLVKAKGHITDVLKRISQK